ncbi:MAG: hypothetical protein K8R59_16300 [Thermoanaerobaculales bacterium]|nr:hypothetical protein [Thermoanaerobaculales bacterium]
MTALWFAVIVVGGIGGLAAGIWLLVLAFRESLGWGLACLFIPFAALVFAVKFWDEAKIPFIITLVSAGVVLVGTLGYSMFTVNAGLNDFSEFDDSSSWNPRTELPPDGDPISYPSETPWAIEERDDVDTLVEDAGTPFLESETNLGIDTEEGTVAVPIESEPPPEGRGRRKNVTIPKANLHLMIGEKVELILYSGQRISARVESITADKVFMKHRVGGGSVTYSVPLGVISEVRIRRAP